MTMRRIDDVDFLKKLFRDYCLRPVRTRGDHLALKRLHVEVFDAPDGAMTIRVNDAQGRVLDVGWRPGHAWMRWALCVNDGIATADPHQLARFIARFLRKHGLISSTPKRGVA
jgi:hypothetical protein